MLLACIAIFFPLASGQVAKHRKNVLMLYWDNKDIPGNITF